jgi:hypothetical protein
MVTLLTTVLRITTCPKTPETENNRYTIIIKISTASISENTAPPSPRLSQLTGCPPRLLGFEPRLGHVVDKVALWQVFSECQFSFQLLLHNRLSSGAGTIGQLLADVPSGLSLTPPQETERKLPSLRVAHVALGYTSDSSSRGEMCKKAGASL